MVKDFLVLARKRRTMRGSVFEYVTEQNKEVDEARSKKDKPELVMNQLKEEHT